MRAIEAGLRFLSNQGVVKHETSAGYMAAAYARISGIPTICVGSSNSYCVSKQLNGLFPASAIPSSFPNRLDIL
jgi:hypothetical protein